MRAFIFFLFILAVLWWWWGLRRAAILFSLTVKNGEIVKIQGRIPPALLSEIRDVVSRAGVIQGKFQAVSRDGHPVLLFEGEMNAGLEQQMRNVMGQFTVSQIRTGARH